MKLQDLVSIPGQLEQVQGVEKRLLRRRRIGKLGMAVAVAAAIFEVLVLALGVVLQVLDREAFSLDEFVALLSTPYVLAAASVFILGLGVYFLYRWTGVLLKESEAPLQYTFWIEAFKPVEAPSDNRREASEKRFTLKASDRFHLLHHDLMERLNERIQRLSLLEAGALLEEERNALTAHVHVDGHYAVREDKKDGEWVVHVMPRVRIGSPGRPATLANAVKYPLTQHADASLKEGSLRTEQYNQMIERVYSSVATEIYKQIEADVLEKIGLFPTRRLQAVALFHEAEDFARSNTIDAYDHALKLYREASQRLRLDLRWLTNWLVSLPLLWRLRLGRTHLHARIHTGYAKCLIYRRLISALSGRTLDPLFKSRPALEQAIWRLEQLHQRMNETDFSPEPPDPEPPEENRLHRLLRTLEAFPESSRSRRLSFRPRQKLLDRQRQILFGALVVSALTHYFLGAFNKADELLRRARDVDPQRSEVDGREVDALYLLTRALIEPEVDREITLFRRATEIEPDFQIAQYFLAYYAEQRFRRENEISWERARSVIDEYEEVLKINPGNIAALAAQGYLYWLLEKLDEAQKKLEEGLEIKATARKTFVGEIQYGLARIAAEQGRFDDSYDLYKQAVAADPRVGAYGSMPGSKATIPYYSYIGTGILARYNSFLTRLKELCAQSKEVSKTVVNAIHSFALNDYGNACLNYYFRFGDGSMLREAIGAYEKAIEIDAHNTIAKYNLSIAYLWSGSQDGEQDIHTYLREVSDKIPEWKAPVVLRVQLIRRKVDKIKSKREKAQSEKKTASVEKAERERLQKAILSIKERLEERTDRPQTKPASSQTDNPRLDKVNAPQTAAFRKPPEQPEKYSEQQRDQAEQQIQIRFLEQVQIRFLEQERDRAKEKLNEATERAKKAAKRAGKLEEEIDQLQKETKEDYRQGVEQIIKPMQIASLFEASDHERCIDELLSSRRFRWEELAEDDVEALKAYAEILLYKEDAEASSDPTQNEKPAERASDKQELATLRRIENLTDRILETFYPDDFDVNRTREQAFRRLSESSEEGGYNYEEKEKTCTEVVKQTVTYWLKQDPVFYISIVNWHYTYFYPSDEKEHREVFRRARDIRSDNPEYLHNLARFYKEAGDAYKEAGDAESFSRAVDLYEIALEIEPCNAPCPERATIFDAIGNAHFRQEQHERAVENYQKAVEHFPEHPDYPLHLNKASGAERFGALRLPAITPIAVEVASSLVPYIVKPGTEDLRPVVAKQIAEMREAISQTMGIQIPSIHFQDRAWLDRGAYRILVNEIPVESERVLEGRWLFAGSPAALKAIDVSGWDATNPQTGEPAVWIDEEHRATVEQAGLKLWDVSEYVVRHLEGVLRKNLSVLLGHQEAMALLEDRCPSVHQYVRAHPEHLGGLVAVLKGLLSEGVPVTPFEKVAETWSQHCQHGKDVTAIVEELRSLPELRFRLPGNNERHRFYQLGPSFEEAVRSCASEDGEHQFGDDERRPMLAIKHQRYQALVSALQHVDLEKPVALLTSQTRLRPFVRAVVRSCLEGAPGQRPRSAKWPLLPVLSRGELRPGLEGRIIGNIELQPPA